MPLLRGTRDIHNGLKNVHFFSHGEYGGNSCAQYVIWCVPVGRNLDFRPGTDVEQLSTRLKTAIADRRNPTEHRVIGIPLDEAWRRGAECDDSKRHIPPLSRLMLKVSLSWLWTTGQLIIMSGMRKGSSAWT